MSLQPVPEVEMAGGSLAAERRAQEHGEEEQLIGSAGQTVLEGRKNVKVKFLLYCSLEHGGSMCVQAILLIVNFMS
jgi:hypothetical protein